MRINTLLAPLDDVVERLAGTGIPFRKIGWYDAGFTVSESDRSSLISTDLYSQRLLYLQNLSSMIPVLELDVQPEQHVLDLAAAPGSKTLQIAAMLKGEGALNAVEVVRKRFFKLKKNLADHGARDVRVYLQDGRNADRHRPSFFDRVLLDAPCSTEGRFVAGEPMTYRYWSVRKIREMAFKQKQLLESAIRCVKPGGLVVYSTCSFAPEENEEVVQHALNTFGDKITIEAPSLNVNRYADPLPSWGDAEFDAGVGATRRVLPDRQYEAFYIARIRRLEAGADRSTIR